MCLGSWGVRNNTPDLRLVLQPHILGELTVASGMGSHAPEDDIDLEALHDAQPEAHSDSYKESAAGVLDAGMAYLWPHTKVLQAGPAKTTHIGAPERG